MKHLGTKQIETRRLVLRRFMMEDARNMYKNWASDTDVTKFLKWPTHTSIEVTKNILTGWIAGYEKEDKYEWCIELKENKMPIGSIGAFGIDEKVQSVEIGYCISRRYWHQGITSEALAAVMKFLLEEVGVNRIGARHDVKNPHSGNVMKKCGLKYEGTIIQGDWNNTGICDSVCYGYVKRLELTETTEAKVQYQTRKPGNHEITDETIDQVQILAKLELSCEERQQAKKDMGEMLDYIDQLKELNTEGIEPLSHIFSVSNVFREDVVTNGDGREMTLKNAPDQKDGGFKVPKTIS